MEDLISVVIPIYNVEKYLKKCVESILKQTYENIEIILVDDGSLDNCGNICEEFANIDNRIKVIHKKNGGLSDARNHGIKIAKGKYITFVDSDDYVEKTYIEKLYNAIKINGTKISQCNILIVNDNEKVLEKLGYSSKLIKYGKDMIIDFYGQHGIENIVVWNKMYLIDLFKNLKYPKGKIHEDEFITYKILYNTDKIAIIDDYLYNYRQNNNSIMGKKFNIKRLAILEALEERLEFFFDREDEQLYKLTLMAYLQKIRESYINTKKYISNSKSIQIDLIKKYRNTYKAILKFKDIKKELGLKMFLFYILPELYYKIKKSKY